MAVTLSAYSRAPVLTLEISVARAGSSLTLAEISFLAMVIVLVSAWGAWLS